MFCEQINKLHFSFTKKTVEVTQNNNDPNHFDCKDEIHVPEGHAVVNELQDLRY